MSRRPMTHEVSAENPRLPAGGSSVGSAVQRIQEKVLLRVRIRFRKVGDLRWIGHRDLARTMERIFRRANLVLATSQGYHPKPRVSFPSPLPLGLEGWNEVVEVQLAEPMDLSQLVPALNQQSVPGLEFTTAIQLPPRAPAARVASCCYFLPLDAATGEALYKNLCQALAASHWPVSHGTAGKVLNLKEHLYEWHWEKGCLWLRLRPSEAGGPTIREVLKALGLEDLEKQGGVIIRSNVILEDEPAATRCWQTTPPE